MKCNQFLCGVAVCTIVTLLFTSCQKESIDVIVPKSEVNVSATGLEEDDPTLVSKVPMIMSANFSSIASPGPILNGKPARGGKGDVIAPVVSITSPTNGSSLSGTVNVDVSANDNVAVSSVSLIVDGTVLKTLTTAPYTFMLDITSLGDGTHTLSAKAKDAKNNEGSQTITICKNSEIIILTPISLPSSAMLVTPPVGNQGSEGSCVAFATAYAGRSIEQYYRTGASDYSFSANVFSPEYIYNQTKVGDCGSGTSITACLDFMYAKGVTTWQTVPFSYLNGCFLEPTTTQISEAASFKIPTYSKLLSSDQTAIKAMIIDKHAVIINLNIDNNFINAKAGYTWNSVGDGNAPHGVIICGYDDTKNAFKILNSFGTGWGDAGYLWVDYAVFAARAGYYSYVMNY